jgi:hypothetical protein
VGSDADGDTLTYSATGLPNGLSINPSTGQISGTIAYDAAGSHNVTVTVTDNTAGGPSGDSASVTFTWTVTDTSPVPATITADPTSRPADGTSHSTITVRLKDANGNNLTASGGTVTLTTNRGTLGNVTDNHDGTYTATLTAPNTLGNITVNGKLNGVDLTNSATITLTPVPGSIHGTVTDAASHQALAGATVLLKDGNGAQVAQTTSDASGNYALNSVDNTSYTLVFSATGYLPYTKAVTVPAAQTVGANAALTPQGGSVTGEVTNKRTGLPVAGATVTLTQDGDSRTATTDAVGSYSFAKVSSIHVFSVSASSTQYVTATVTNQSLSPGGTSTVNLQMQPVSSLGITAPADGANVSTPPVVTGTSDVIGATVHVWINGKDVGTAVVAGNGTWSFDLSTLTPSPLLVGPDTIGATAVDGQNTLTAQPVSIKYNPTSSVSGVVYSDAGAPVAGQTVKLLDPAGNPVAGKSTTSAGNGSYQFTNVPAGIYTVVAPDPLNANQPLARAQVYLAPGQAVTFDLHLAGKGILTLTATPASIVGDGHSIAQLKATLTLRNGTPVAGTTVSYTATGGTLNAPSAQTGANGTASVDLTAPTIQGILPVTKSVTVAVNDPGQGIYAQQTIIITFLPASITGVVIDSGTGLPAAGAEVSVAEDFNGDGIIDFAAQTTTGADGTYKITVPRGDWTYKTTIKTHLQVGGKPVEITSTHESQVGALTGLGETISASKTISGQVLVMDQTNTPTTPNTQGASVTGAIIAQDGTQVNQSVTVKPDGTYEIGNLKAGTYTLEFKVTAGGTTLAGTKAQVTVSQDGELAIHTALLDPYGTVTDASSGQPISGAKLTLWWAGTPLNQANGRTPNTKVSLPALNFPPNDNANSQNTTGKGAFAWMVFPNSDYYITAEKAGYVTYDSRTEARTVAPLPGEDSDVLNGIIRVRTNIVAYSFTMQRVQVAPPAAPAAPTGLTATPGNGRVDLSWNPVAGAQSYLLQRATSADGPYTSVGTGISGTAFSDTGVTNGVTYYYKVAASGAGGTSAWSGVASATPQAPAPTPAPNPAPKPTLPAAPTGLTATPGDAQVALAWNPVPGAQTYTVRRATGPGGPYTVIASGLTGLSYIDQGVANGTTYYYVVTATGSAGDSTPSAEVSAKPTAPPRPSGHHKRYILGYPDGTFRPERSISRAEVATILARILDAEQLVAAAPGYPDVSRNHWSYQNIAVVTQLGLMQGDPTGLFRPNDPITRAEIATIAVRFKKVQFLSGSAAFPDTAGHWANTVIATANRMGIVQGYPDGTFQPQRATSRAEFVTIVNRLLARGPLLGRPGQLWPDVPATHWAFGQVSEASVNHTYEPAAPPTQGETWQADGP